MPKLVAAVYVSCMYPDHCLVIVADSNKKLAVRNPLAFEALAVHKLVAHELVDHRHVVHALAVHDRLVGLENQMVVGIDFAVDADVAGQYQVELD